VSTLFGKPLGFRFGIAFCYPDGMTEEEAIARIRKSRQALNRAQETVAKAEKALADEVRSAYEAGVKTGPISRAAEWSDTYVRSIREGKVLK